jgi:two-component system, sensor histidine kinase and response regulator
LPACIKGDPARIRQVLLNLAGNAVKFTEGGSVLIAAEQLEAERVKVSVTDTGIGIPDEQMGTLFQKYSQGDPSRTRRYGGTGLGLAISKTLVELMGGEIGAQSAPGSGSTFWFVLPLDAGRAAAAPTAATAPAAAHEVRTPGQTRLLLVEDNFVNQRVAVYMLAKLGHQVDVAKNGREAIEMLSKSGYGLVLMDCQMPEMDGFEATQAIRALYARGEGPHILALTANALDGEREKCLAAGMDDYMAKPIKQDLLRKKMAEWLGGRG